MECGEHPAFHGEGRLGQNCRMSETGQEDVGEGTETQQSFSEFPEGVG